MVDNENSLKFASRSPFQDYNSRWDFWDFASEIYDRELRKENEFIIVKKTIDFAMIWQNYSTWFLTHDWLSYLNFWHVLNGNLLLRARRLIKTRIWLLFVSMSWAVLMFKRRIKISRGIAYNLHYNLVILSNFNTIISLSLICPLICSPVFSKL